MTQYARRIDTEVRQAMPGAAPLAEGPRWYRARIRLIGPLLGVGPMALFGLVSFVSLRLGEGRTSGLIGLISGVTAAPGLLVAGAPLADDTHYPLAVLASIPLWLLLGVVASRRSTRRVVAGWRDFWREMAWLTLGVLLGAAVALIAATAFLGESLIV